MNQFNDRKKWILRIILLFAIGVQFVYSKTPSLQIESVDQSEEDYLLNYQVQRKAKWDQLLAKHPFLLSERLEYEINYGFITAGKAVMQTQVDGDQKILQKVHAYALSAIQAMYPVSDTISTQLKGPDLLPTRFYKITNEGGYHSRTLVEYNQLSREARMGDTVFSDNHMIKSARHTKVFLDGKSHSITSAFLLIRTLDLKPGQIYDFLAVSGRKKYQLQVIAHNYETIEVQDKKYETLRVEPVLDEDGLFRAKGKMNIWLTRDERKLPVLVRSKIPIGSVELELVKVTHP